MTFSLFSICIPTRNRGYILGTALESCLRQTYPNLEVVISDNHSADQTEELVASYAKNDPRVKYFRNPANLGIERNLFRMFALARGEYVQYLADDCWLSANFVEERVRGFQEHPQAGLVTSPSSKYQKIKDGFKIFAASRRKSGCIDSNYVFRTFFRQNWFSIVCSVRRKDLLEAIEALREIPNPYGYDYLNAHMGYDVWLFLYVLSRYSCLYFTDKTEYLEVRTPSEMQDDSLSNFVGYQHMNKYGFEFTLRAAGRKEFFRHYKRYMGGQVLVEILRRLAMGPRSGLGLSWLPRYYSDFQLPDWIFCLLQAWGITMQRALTKVGRMVFSKPRSDLPFPSAFSPQSERRRETIPFSFVVPVYNEELDIEATLAALEKMEYPDYEVVVVDDASEDRTVSIVQTFAGRLANFRLLKQARNLGVASARNRGIREARGEVLVILNADVVLPPDFLQRLVPHYQSGNQWVAVMGKVLNQRRSFSRFSDAESYDEHFVKKKHWVWTEGFSCTKKSALEVGLFPASMPGCSGEDGIFGDSLENRFPGIKDTTIVAPHVAPEDLRGYWQQQKGRGAGRTNHYFYIKRMSLGSLLLNSTLASAWRITKLFCGVPVLTAWRLSSHSLKRRKDFISFVGVAYVKETAMLAGMWSAMKRLR